ncbi:hypothetical protein PsorP6_008269 [Peronosclerospora sorghi]|uniref:Uncharacterized protein n=1 Tax=Peronosclerospora sorghi TaxID=230839 RepID=A0ACC0W9X2_9STRA|nr:hypothetical protein PsorP6_008269 [Peronosclerospora sorghi]
MLKVAGDVCCGRFSRIYDANGIDTTLSVSTKLLSHEVSDARSTCVGGLITQILLKLGPSLPTPTVQGILSAVCACLAATELPSLVQSLCMVFARLVHSHGPDLLNVMGQLLPPPAPVGQFQEAPHMLKFVFQTWMERQQDFYGLYCLKMTMSAVMLAKARSRKKSSRRSLIL